MKGSNRAILFGASLLTVSSALDNGLARTPQMGWNNWNSLACDVSESLLEDTAKIIVGLGLRDLGYNYVVLDDCWSAGRNSSNNDSLVADPGKFPHGMAAIADDIHDLGLRFGMYSSAGVGTCAGYPGSLGYEEIDASTFAEWRVDYLKYDNCGNLGRSGDQKSSWKRYAAMSKALLATGRPILYSMCNWGEDSPWEWAGEIANSWRITGDIYEQWDTADPGCPCDGQDSHICRPGQTGYHCSILNILNKASYVTSGSKPGGWNDLDMLEVGVGHLTDSETIAHFSLWAALKSPLIMGNDLRLLKPVTLSILRNAAVIALNQDPLGQSVSRRWLYNLPLSKPPRSDPHATVPSIQLWSGPLASTSDIDEVKIDAVALLVNGGSADMELSASLADIFAGQKFNKSLSWEVRDLWLGRIGHDDEVGAVDDAIEAARKGKHVSEKIVSGLYNTTKTSYAEGLKRRDERLLGKVVTTISPKGTLVAKVDGRGAGVFRLRAVETDKSGLEEEVEEL